MFKMKTHLLSNAKMKKKKQRNEWRDFRWEYFDNVHRSSIYIRILFFTSRQFFFFYFPVFILNGIGIFVSSNRLRISSSPFDTSTLAPFILCLLNKIRRNEEERHSFCLLAWLPPRWRSFFSSFCTLSLMRQCTDSWKILYFQ